METFTTPSVKNLLHDTCMFSFHTSNNNNIDI